jgi:thiol:disulfide interchange protein DsbD
LALAQKSHHPVILDFYADWCQPCVAMDRHVFGASDIRSKLNDYVLLRADLSVNSGSDDALLRTFNVAGPPTVIFFDSLGREVRAQRIVGEVNKNEFLARLDQVGSQPLAPQTHNEENPHAG